MSQSDLIGDGSREVRVRLCIDADRIETITLIVVLRTCDLDEIKVGCHFWDLAAAELVGQARLNVASPGSLALAS